MLGFPIGVIPALVTLSVSHIPPGCPSAAVWYLWVHPSVSPPMQMLVITLAALAHVQDCSVLQMLHMFKNVT